MVKITVGLLVATAICAKLVKVIENENNCHVLCDFVLFVQSKKGERHPWRSGTFSKVEK